MEAWARQGLTDLPLTKRRKVLMLTASTGVVENLQAALAAAGCALGPEAMEAAAAAGHQPMCAALRRYHCPWGAALTHAAGGGHRELCMWLLSEGAAGSGANTQQQQQLHATWGLWDRSAMAAAARGGHLDLAGELWAWAHERGLVSTSAEQKGRAPPPQQPAVAPPAPAPAPARPQLLPRLEEATGAGAREQGVHTNEGGEGGNQAAQTAGSSSSNSSSTGRTAVTAPATASRAGRSLPWGDLAAAPMVAGAAHSVDVDTLEWMLCEVHGSDGRIEQWQPQPPLVAGLHGPPPTRSLLMDPDLVPYVQRAAIVAAAAGSAEDWDLKIEMLEARGLVQVHPGCMPEAATTAAGLWPPPLALHRLNWLVQRGYGVSYLATRAAVLALAKASVEKEAADAAAAAAAAAADTLRELFGRDLEPPAGAGAGAGAGAAAAGAGTTSTGRVSGLGEVVGEAGGGDDRLQVLEFVLRHQAGVTDDTANIAAAAGLLDVLQLFDRSLNVRMNFNALILEAARAGQLHCVNWLAARHGADCRLTHSVLAAAAEGGAVEVAAWLHQRGLEAEPEWADRDQRAASEAFPVRAAAAGGSAAALRWLVEHGYPMPEDGSPYVFAIRNGDVVMLRTLRALGCRWDPHASPQLVAAARSAQLTSGCGAVMVWLEEQGLDLEKVERDARKQAQQRRVEAARAKEAAEAAAQAHEQAASSGACQAEGTNGEGRLAAWWRRVKERIRRRRVQEHYRCGGVTWVDGCDGADQGAKWRSPERHSVSPDPRDRMRN